MVYSIIPTDTPGEVYVEPLNEGKAVDFLESLEEKSDTSSVSGDSEEKDGEKLYMIPEEESKDIAYTGFLGGDTFGEDDDIEYYSLEELI